MYRKHREREAVLQDGVWVRRKQGRCGELCPMHLKAAALYSMTQWASFEEIIFLEVKSQLKDKILFLLGKFL